MGAKGAGPHAYSHFPLPRRRRERTARTPLAQLRDGARRLLQHLRICGIGAVCTPEVYIPLLHPTRGSTALHRSALSPTLPCPQAAPPCAGEPPAVVQSGVGLLGRRSVPGPGVRLRRRSGGGPVRVHRGRAVAGARAAAGDERPVAAGAGAGGAPARPAGAGRGAVGGPRAGALRSEAGGVGGRGFGQPALAAGPRG